MDLTIRHQPDEQRFVATVDGLDNLVEYRIADGVMTLVHTEVDPSLGGRGLGGRLVQAALDHAAAHGLKVVPACSYARAYIARSASSALPGS